MWLKPRLLSGARSPLKYPRPSLIPRFHGGGGAGRPRRPRLGQLIAAAETSLPLKFPEGSGRRTCDRPKEPNYFLTRRKRWAGEGDPRHGDPGVPRLELGPQRHLGDPLLAGRTPRGQASRVSSRGVSQLRRDGCQSPVHTLLPGHWLLSPTWRSQWSKREGVVTSAVEHHESHAPPTPKRVRSPSLPPRRATRLASQSLCHLGPLECQRRGPRSPGDRGRGPCTPAEGWDRPRVAGLWVFRRNEKHNFLQEIPDAFVGSRFGLVFVFRLPWAGHA